MTPRDLTRLRLVTQQIDHIRHRTPGEVVAALGAMQAQDYPGALWAVALRLPDATGADIEQAIRDRTILRTWPMRGTLHFVAPEDARWMLRLLTPRLITSTAARRRELGLDDEVFRQSRKVIEGALEGGRILTRTALCGLLEREGISTAGQRGIHILWRLSQDAVLCYGPHEGKQPTFVLFDAWVPKSRELTRDESLAELARRYFTGHGPATVQDLAWWAGIKISDAKAGLKRVESELEQARIDDRVYWMPKHIPAVKLRSPTVHLLPGFDEYMLGYADRSAALEPEHAQKIVPGNNGMFMATLVIDGKIRGTWRRAVKKSQVVITPLPFEPLSAAEKEGVEEAAGRYGRFLGLKAGVG